jgi:hypothetical protein
MRTIYQTLSWLSPLLPSFCLANDTSIETGYFIDSPVTGLYYQTSSNLSGRTDKGAFQFRSGDVVNFFLGEDENGYLLSTVSAQSVLTPNHISTKPSRSINITRLLLSLDSTPKNRQEILLLDSHLSDARFQEALTKIDLNQLVEDDIKNLQLDHLASVQEAVEHLNQSQKYIRENFQSEQVIFEPINRYLTNVIIKQRDNAGRLCAFDLRLRNHPNYKPPIGKLTYKITQNSIVEYPDIGDDFRGCQIQPRQDTEQVETPLVQYPDSYGTFHCAARGCTRNDLNGFTIDDFNDEGDYKYRSIAINFDPTTQLLMEKSQGLGVRENITHPNKGEKIWFTFPKEHYTRLNYQGVWRQTTYEQNQIDESCLWIANGLIKRADLVGNQCPLSRDHYQQNVTHQFADMWWVRADTSTASIEQLNLIVRWYLPKQPRPKYTTWEYLPAGEKWDKGVLYRYQQQLTKTQDGTELLRTESVSEYRKVKESI